MSQLCGTLISSHFSQGNSSREILMRPLLDACFSSCNLLSSGFENLLPWYFSCNWLLWHLLLFGHGMLHIVSYSDCFQFSCFLSLLSNPCFSQYAFSSFRKVFLVRAIVEKHVVCMSVQAKMKRKFMLGALAHVVLFTKNAHWAKHGVSCKEGGASLVTRLNKRMCLHCLHLVSR